MNNLPIPINQLVLLQAYLYEVFSYEKRCRNSFDNSEWYLRDKHNEEKVKSISDYFRSKNINCDCDIINMINLKDLLSNINYHH